MTEIGEIKDFEELFYNSMVEITQKWEDQGLLSDDWEGDFMSDPQNRKQEELVTFTFRNIKVHLKHHIKFLNNLSKNKMFECHSYYFYKVV